MNLYDMNIDVFDIKGNAVDLTLYRGEILIIVNTASKCGFTPQFKGLERLYKEYKDKGVAVLGFPCNQFRAQDPGTNEEILEFCTLNYDVTFPMFQKLDVNGENRHPLYHFLIDNAPKSTGADIKWNFEKFVIDKEGEVAYRFASLKTPKAIEKVIKKMV